MLHAAKLRRFLNTVEGFGGGDPFGDLEGIADSIDADIASIIGDFG